MVECTNNKKNIEKKKKGVSKKKNIEIVYIDVSDVLEIAIQEILETHGGIYYNDVEYVGTENIDGRDRLKFTIPKKDRTGKCNEISEPDPEDGGCGDTGGACICGKPEGHEDDHECELCGHEW